MSDDRAYGLEQKCLYPGHWLIEGFKVIRRTTSRHTVKWPVEWHITGPGHDKPVIVRTLAEAREWIADDIEAGRPG